MKERRYKITISGARSLLMHHDNIPGGERVKRWQKDPKNRDLSVAGDDRSPAWVWLTYCYHDGKRLIVPSDNLMTALREGAKRVPTGKRGTFKAQSQSGILVDQESWPLTVYGKEISWEILAALADELNFEKHEAAASALGFELFVKRARVGTAKHVRVRPRFENWACEGTVTILDDTITEDVLRDILSQSGRFAGLGDWRPSSPKSPGPFGTFTATVEEA